MAKLPSVTSSIPRDLQQFILRVKETLEGNGPDAMVSARQLIAAGIADGVGNGGITSPKSDVVDSPRAPSNVSAAGALATIIVSWNSPAYRGHAYSEIWAAGRTQAQTDASPQGTPIIGQAELVGMTAGNNFSHNIGGGAQRWYWVRFVNRNGVAGPYNLTEGTFGQTGQDPAYLLSVLTDAVTSSQLANALSTRIDLVDADASVEGSVNQRVQTVATVAGDNTAAIQVNATSVGGLEAQYTVKIDNNGAVAGFGLASTTTDSGSITSEFLVNADRFAIMRGGSDTTAATVPFVVQATATTVNGEDVPAGVYMADAFIKNGTITNAKIGNLTADKITASLLNTVDFYGNTIAGSTIYLGGTITYTTDADGNNIGIASVASPQVAMTSTGANFATGAFVINNGSTNYTPFQVVGGVAYLNNAMIKDSTLSFAKVSDDIQSTDYSAGSNGWKIAKGGAMEMNNATFRGTLDIDSGSGSRLTVNDEKIEVFDGSSLRVRIGKLN